MIFNAWIIITVQFQIYPEQYTNYSFLNTVDNKRNKRMLSRIV